MHDDKGLSLRGFLADGEGLGEQYLCGVRDRVRLAELVSGTMLAGRLAELGGRSVFLKTKDHFSAALALVELDGVAKRIVLYPPCLTPEHLPQLFSNAEVDAVVHEEGEDVAAALAVPLRIAYSPLSPSAAPVPSHRYATEWLLLTSGTTGVPKIVVHTLASLTDPIKIRRRNDPTVVWGTFYDIRRYGGLQIYLRALRGRTSLVLSGASEPTSAFLERLRQHAVTHLSGTPSHWRRVLMMPANELPTLRYLRLSGEIADQALLDSLRRTYPHAQLAHAYASTEAGVVFAVEDRLEGFPASFLNGVGKGVAMKIEDATLRVRSRRTASKYAGSKEPLLDADGFVDTGDVVQRRGERYYFMGRRGGIVNVGGLKVHPEEVESVINRHPDVRMSLVRARKNPFTGAVVVADVLLRDQRDAGNRGKDVEREILDICRGVLPEYKVPALIRFVSSLDVAESGKLVRPNA